jgi:putative salt-induced outer membrane protein YdiY
MRKLIASLVLAAAPAWAVVDIAPQEVGAHPGLSGNVAASWSVERGNTDKKETDLSGKLQYDSNRRSLAFIQATYEQSESSDVETENDTLAHARYLHKLYGDALYGEGFVQFYENVFQGIDHRWLAGGDLRWRFLNIPSVGKLYVGVGAFQEEQKFTEDFPEEDESTTRMNSYLAYTRPLTEESEFSVIGYYQPAFESTSDYYASLNAELVLHVVSDLYLSLMYEIDHDSKPPEGIDENDEAIKTSLVWKF